MAAALLLLFTLPTPTHSAPMTTSWYQAGHTTASGRRFHPDGLTAAHKYLPFGTRLHLRYKGKRVKVVVNDRGPFVKGRHLDISRGAARVLALNGVGVVDAVVD